MAQMVAFRYRHFPPPPGASPDVSSYRLIPVTVALLALVGCGRTELGDADIVPSELGDADIVGLDAVALRAELGAGRLSALQVTEAYLRRIAALDDAGPTLSAVIEINPDAEAIARGL